MTRRYTCPDCKGEKTTVDISEMPTLGKSIIDCPLCEGTGFVEVTRAMRIKKTNKRYKPVKKSK